MRKIYPTLFGLVFLAAACGPAATPVPTATTAPTAEPAAPARVETLHVELAEELSALNLPWALAVDDLREQGYTVETVYFDDTALAMVALAQGDLDIISSGYQIGWSAIAEGAAAVTVLERQTNNFVLTASNEIETCDDLDGKGVAVFTLSGVSTSILNKYLAENCPGVEPEILVISGASNRQAALLAGEIVALLQQDDQHFALDAQEPGRFHVLINLSESYPDLQVTGYLVPRSLAEQYPETVKDMIRAILLQRRRLADPEALKTAFIERMELDPETAQGLADLYSESPLWSVNGALDKETVQSNLTFLQDLEAVPANLTPEDVADWSYLDQVIAEIGAQ